MFSLVRKWASHLIHKHGQKFVKEVPEELLQFSLSSCSVEIPRLDLQERLFENLGVLLPFEVAEAYLEDVAVSLRWRGSSCTIVVEARLLVVRGKMRSLQDWEPVLRENAPELESKEAAQSYKAAALRAHEDEVLDMARRLLGTAALDQSGSLPDIDFKLGDLGGNPSMKDVDTGFQLHLEEENGTKSGMINLTGSGLEICDGVNLNEILNPSQAFRLDFRLKDLTASCQEEERMKPCIGPCEELCLEFTFAQSRKVKAPKVELPSAWPMRSMTQAFEEMDELPTVSLAICSTSCPVRASLAQVAFFTAHGLSWGRWFAFREALAVQLDLTEDAQDVPVASTEIPFGVVPTNSTGSSTGGPGSGYQRKWLRQLPRQLDASSVRQADPEVDQDSHAEPTDPYLASYEEKQLLRKTLRERRLALLNPNAVDEENRGLVIASQQCMCSERTTSYDVLLTDPTARHTFALVVNLTCSEVELVSESSSLAVIPTSTTSGIVVDLGVHDAPDLKPLALRLALSDCELRRRSATVTARDSTLSQRSSASGASSSLGSWQRGATFGEPPLLQVVGLTTFVMDLTEPDDAELADIRSPRWYLDIGGRLQACVSYPLLLDVLELVGQLQIELLDVTAEELLLEGPREESEVQRERVSSGSMSASMSDSQQRRSSLMYMPVSLEEGWEEEVGKSALVEILSAIRHAAPEPPPSPSTCTTDLRITAVNAPLTLLVPCSRTIDGNEERVLGAMLEGLLVMQLRLQCEAAENSTKEDEATPSQGMLRTHPAKESHAVSSQLFSAREISAWLLPEDPARHLLKTSFADVDLTQHRGRPLLMSCQRVLGRVVQNKELHLNFELEEVILHVSISDAVLLSLLFRSLSAGGPKAPPEASETPEASPRRSVLEVVANGISMRLLHASAGRGEASLKVLARLDIGTQELHMVSEEEVELLLYTLQHVLLTDRQQEVTLLRLFGEQSWPCVKLRYGNGVAKNSEASMLLGHLQLLSHWGLCGSLLACLTLMKSEVASSQGKGNNNYSSPPPSSSASGPRRDPISLVVRGRFQQILFYMPTFGEGLEEQGGLLLSCGIQWAGGPVKHKGHWKGRAQVSQLSLMAVDSLEPSKDRSGSSAILHPMRLQLILTMKAQHDEHSRHPEFYGLRVLVEPVRITLQPNHLKAVNVLQGHIDALKADLDAAEQRVQAPRASQAKQPPAHSGSPWTGQLEVIVPVLRVGAVASPEEPESCIVVLEAVTAQGVTAIGTAIGVETCGAAEQAAAAAAVAAASAMAAPRSAKAAAQAATAAASAAAAATAQDAEESVTALDFCLQLQATVGAIYADVVSINGPEEQEMPMLEPTSIDLQVPAYQGLRTKRKVWLGKELLQAFCPQVSITWVNVHASEVNAAVLSRLYSCFEAARQFKRRQGGFSLQHGEEDQIELTRERTGRRAAVQTLRNGLGTCAVIAVPDKSGERFSRLIARLVPEDLHGLPLEVASRRARKVTTRVFRSRGTKQQRIAKSRSALLDTVAVDSKSPVRGAFLPMISKAEEMMMGAGRVAKGAVKDTVKRSGEVFRELRKAAMAEDAVVSREVDEADELERVLTRGLRFGEKEPQGRAENMGLGLLPGWPLADLKAALRHRSRACTVVNLPLLPPITWTGRDSLRSERHGTTFLLGATGRFSRTSELSSEAGMDQSDGNFSPGKAPMEGYYEDDNETDTTSNYSRSNSGAWSMAENQVEEDPEECTSPGSNAGGSSPAELPGAARPRSSLRSSLRSQRSVRSNGGPRFSGKSRRSSQTSGSWSNLERLWRYSSRETMYSGSWTLFGRQSVADLGPRAKRRLQTMNTAAKDMAGFASEVAGKAVNKVKNFALQRKLKRGIARMEFTSKVLVRKVAPAVRKDMEGSCELEMSSTIFLQNRSSVPMVVFPLADDAKTRLLEGEDAVQQYNIVGLLQKCGWLTMNANEAPQAVPLMWCVSERVFRAVNEAQQVAEDMLMETERQPGGLSRLLDEDSQVWHENMEMKVAEAVKKAAGLAFAESQNQKKPLQPWCCPLASLEEVGLDSLSDKAPDEVLPALKQLMSQGSLQPLLEDGSWNALIGAKKLSNQKEMLGRRLEKSLRGLCSTINGVGTSRPRSPEDSLFFLVTVEYMVRVCNRLCCTLEITPSEEGEESWSVLPGEDTNCRQLDQLQLELLLPAEGKVHGRSSVGSLRSTEDDDDGKEVERYELLSPSQLLETVAVETQSRAASPRRTSIRKGNSCIFKAPGDGKLVEVQIHREEGVVQEHCHWPDLHATQFGSHTSQITLFVSHWLVNRANCNVVIPHPRSVAGLSLKRTTSHMAAATLEPLMIIPGHSLRPLSQHALQDGNLEIGLRPGQEASAGTPSLLRTSTLRTRRNMFTAQKLTKTGHIKVDRPGKGGVLPSLALADSTSSGSLCVGFAVNQAPFPFYRTLVVEITRRYTLVNLKSHQLWVSDGSRALELPPGEPKAYHPNNGDAEFHLDLSGVGPNNFTAGFRLSQLFNVEGSTSGRRGKLQLMYMVSGEDSGRGSVQSNGSCSSFSGQRWGLIAVEAMEDSSALILRFSDPAKPQFRMVNRSRGPVAFRQDHSSSPFFYLESEGVLNFAWYSPPSFRSAAVAPENVPSGLPALLLGPAGDNIETEEDLQRLTLHRYDIAQVREHQQLEFPQVQVVRSGSNVSQAMSKKLSRMTRRLTTRMNVPPAPPDVYKVRTTVHQGSLEVHIFPWVRVSNQTTWPVTVRADSSDDGKLVESEEWVDLWPHGNNRGEMLFQMKRSGEYAEGSAFEWSQPLTLSESMTTYRGFFRQRCGGEAETVEVAVARDEISGFLRLTLAHCRQEPYLIENKSSEKCRFAPKNATGWVMNLQNGDGDCPFFSHLWGGDTWMTMTVGARGEISESLDFDLAVAGTYHLRDLVIEVGKAKQPRKVLVKDSTVSQRRISRRSIRERGVVNTLNRMSVAFRNEHLGLGVARVRSLMSNPEAFAPKAATQVTFAEEPEVEQQQLNSLISADADNVPSHRRSLESSAHKRARFIEWVTMTSTLSSAMTSLNMAQRKGCCSSCFKPKPTPQPVRRKKAMRMSPAKKAEVALGEDAERLDWALDLTVEGVAVAMLDMQLDTRDSHELGYASLRLLTVKLRQVAAKTDVEGKAGALWSEVKLRSAHLDVGTGEARHHSKACHSVVRPFTGPLQILHDGEPPPILHLEALLKLVTENQEGSASGSKATIDTREGSAHYEVRRMELRVEPVGLHIETALVSEVVVWVLELCSVLKTGTLRQQNAMQHFAHALDAEDTNLEDASLVDLKYSEPRCVQNPTAEDFKDQVPVVIRELTLRKICCVMTLSFTGTGDSTAERKEELQALEMLLRLTLPLDVHQARLVLGKMTRRMSVTDFTVRERFLSNGSEELLEILVSQLTHTLLVQVPKLFGSQLLIGNPRRLGEELFRAAELGAHGITRIKPKVVLAAVLLGFAAFTTALRGIFLIVSKETCRISTGQVPDQLLREPARVRQSIAQALYYGLPWHCHRLALRLRNRWKDWGRRCGVCEGLKLMLLAIFWIMCAVISALLVMVTKIIQALELLERRTARWASPTYVTAIGPPTPMRTGSQQFVAGYPKQFSRTAARPLATLKAEMAYVSRADWLLRELPERSRLPGDEFQDDDENLWGWLLLLRSSAQLILVQPAQQLPSGLRVELVEPPPEETRRIKGPFLRVELDIAENMLMCYVSMSKIEYLHLPCREAALTAFSLAAENVFRG